MALFRFLPTSCEKLPIEHFDRVYATRWDRVPIRCDVAQGTTGWQMSTEGDSSVYGYFPWRSPQLGELVLQTTTLAVRPAPYDLLTELARGSLNQTQNYLAECEHFGLPSDPGTVEELGATRRLLSRVVTQPARSAGRGEEAEEVIERSLALNTILANRLSHAVRQSRPAQSRRVPLGVRLEQVLDGEQATQLVGSSFQVIHLPITWANIEKDEGRFDWSGTDRLFESVEPLGKRVVAGPILGNDVSTLPPWAAARRDQFDKFRDSVSRFVNQVAARYASRVDKWFAVSGLNIPSGLGLNDQLRILLAAGIIERLRRIDADTPRLVAIDQPWGEYLQQPNASLSPTGFLDALIRADIGVDTIGLELNLGSWPRGTLWRHPLSVIQRINEYATLEKPVTLLMRTSEEHAEAAKLLVQLLDTNSAVEAVVWNQWGQPEPEHFPQTALWTPQGPSQVLNAVLAH